jgi:hypothetical protein
LSDRELVFSRLATAEAGLKAHGYIEGPNQNHHATPEMTPEMKVMMTQMIKEQQLKEAKSNIATLQAFRRAKSHAELDTLFADSTATTAKQLEGNLLVKGHVSDRVKFLTSLDEKIKTENIAPYLNALQTVWEHHTSVDGAKNYSKYAPQIREIYTALEGK